MPHACSATRDLNWADKSGTHPFWSLHYVIPDVSSVQNVKNTCRKSCRLCTYICCLLFFFFSPYFICVQFTLTWNGPRVFKPSRQERSLFSLPTTLPVTEDSHPAINLHYGPASSCRAAANSNRLRQLLLTESLMAANERHLGAVDPCAQRDYAVAQSQGLNMGPVSFSISH